ncbi:MAG: thiamine pyrophosphate-binding protein [Propionibacteriaceae bacterium]|jgi:thiamine pyrophosphate-dependent acetolactate synthase large subunit-like protein|nr:thiamine pyrophosphate-binding protein [Propionibacteriaceae bacterium]
MLVAHAFARALAEDGDTILFGLLGNTNIELVTGFAEQPGCRYVPALNEDAVVCMASGYGSVTGKVGVATVIKGPGVTNTLTALTDAVRARMPLLLIAADSAVGVRDGDELQKVPQRDFVLPTGAAFEQVRAPETALADLREARRRAVLESRPVFVNVPLQIFKAEIDYVPGGGHRITGGRVKPDPDELGSAVDLLASARRPLILAGRGAASKEARASLLRLSAVIGAPLMTTLRGKCLFNGELGDLGLFGTLASDAGAEVIRRADCVLAFGTSLNYRTTGSGDLLKGKAVMQVDTNRATIGRGACVNAPVTGDAGTVADAIANVLVEKGLRPTAFRAEASALRLQSGFTPKPHAEGTVDFHAALRCIERSVPADRVLAVDNGYFMYSTYKSISVLDPFSYVHTTNVGAIGLGLGHALGAAVGAPGRPTLLVTGDGGFMCSGVVEFRTAVNNGLDLIVAVLNDSAYGAEYVRMVARGQDPALTTFSRPDFAALGEALGGQGFTVKDEESLAQVPQLVANRTKPLLIEFRIDPAATTKAPVPAEIEQKSIDD